jgi:chemotaxis protein CheD
MAVIELIETAQDIAVGMGQVVTAKSPSSLKAILGSCVAIAIYHPRKRIGAMAHVVLPDSNGQDGVPGKFADTAVPYMLDKFKALGIRPAELAAKLTGGANMFNNKGPLQIGDRNVQAAIDALSTGGIRIAAKDVGGQKGRRVIFSLATGEVVVDTAGQAQQIL